MLPLTQTGLMTGWRNTPPKTAMGLDFNPSMQQLGQNVLPVFDSLVFF